VLGLALLGIGGAALSAVQLFTGLQAAGESARSKLAIEMARTFAFPPENLLTTAMPHIFGQLTGDPGYWGRWFLWEDSLFIGTTALILAIYGAVRGEAKQKRFATTFLVVSMLLAFGYYTPLYELLYRFFPGISSFRGISKFAFLAALFLANLSAVGLDRLFRVPQAPRKPAIAVALSGLILAIAGATIWLSASTGLKGFWGKLLSRISWTSEGYLYGPFRDNKLAHSFILESGHNAALNICIAAGVCMVVAAMWLGAQKDRRWVYGIAIVATLELLAFAWQNTMTFDLKQITTDERQLAIFAKLVGADQRAMTGMPTVYMMAGGNDGWGNDPMVLRRYSDLIAYGQQTPGDADPSFANPGPLWGLARIKGALIPTANGVDPRKYNLRTLGRAQLIDTAEVIDDPKKLLATLADPQFAPSSKALLEKPLSIMPNGSGGDHLGAGSVDVIDRTTDAMEITADVRRTSILLVTDNYCSGWRVRSLDESPVQKEYPVVRADYTFRGIPLMPGKHHFLLEYMPAGYVAGKIVTLVSLLGYIVAGFLLWGPLAARFGRVVPESRKSSPRKFIA